MLPLNPGFARDHRDEMVEGLKALKKGLEEPDFTVLFHTCNNIAMVRWRANPARPWSSQGGGAGAAEDLMPHLF